MTSSTRRYRAVTFLAPAFAALLLAGCAAQEPAPDADAEGAAAAAADAGEMADSAQPRVFFTNVEDGGTYSSPLEIVFGVENFDIVPVEKPPVVRQGEGHYHLAVDAACVAAGEIVPPGTPSYIHFGDGSDHISLQLDPGQHTLCLQVANGEHRVIDGPGTSDLTKQIIVNIEE